MTTIRIRRTIHAAVSEVFETVAHIENYARAIDDIVDVEYLSEQHSGVGTKFREKRELNGRPASAVLEVKEYEPGRRVRWESDENGTVWDSTFTFRETDDGCELELVTEARAYKLRPRILNPLFKKAIQRAVAKDIDALQAYCEGLETSEEE